MRHGACARLGVGLLGTRAGGEPECHEQDTAAGSVGGAQVAAQHLSQAGLTGAAHALSQAAQLAFLHSLTGACLVAAGMAGAGVLLVTFLLPARPQTQQAGIRAADNTTAHIARGPAGALAPGASTVVPGPATPPSPALPERPAP